jgi:hypothetical protein
MMPDELAQPPADALLSDELASDDVVEMANLTDAQTGVRGTILISTAIGANGPRVKYFVQPGRTQLRRMAPQVIDWVSRNRQDLLDFWYHGDTWTQPEANAFIQRLRRV